MHDMTTAPTQFLYKDKASNCEVWMKRLDLQFEQSIGNKAYKLRYNLKRAREESKRLLLTFGGAFSNHIAAVALRGKQEGFQTIGVIRGEELGTNLTKTLQYNPTLRQAVNNGMKLHFISRKAYRKKHCETFLTELRTQFGDFYMLPEGGTNPLAVRGCKEILSESDKGFDVICCSVGTGGTISGIIESLTWPLEVRAYSALKADLRANIEGLIQKSDFKIWEETHFGGFAKINSELVSFINRFANQYQILLDPIYTAKMMFAIEKQLKEGSFKTGSRILAIHTGGLQSIAGMNNRLAKRKLPLITLEKA